MKPSLSQRAFQVVLTVIGCVAVVAGTSTVALGADSIAGAGEASPSLDSEIRFYAAWYIGAGLLLLRDARRVPEAGTTIRAVAMLFFVAGSGRVISILVVGRPHPLALFLMAVELAMPFVLLPWYAWLVRAAPR